jgi:hypothetical protein
MIEGDCQYCKDHGLDKEFPSLHKRGGNHAIATAEQRSFFDDPTMDLFNDRRSNG